jgi:dephospho-CoA kinase
VIARQVVQRGEPALREIVSSFGDGVLTREGDLNRKALGDAIFNDPKARQRLNEITHPRIRQQAFGEAKQWAAQGHELIAYEAALLVEAGLADHYRPLVLVACDEATQIRRLKERDGYSEQEAIARVHSQIALCEKKKSADLVIETTGSLQQVRTQAVEALKSLCRLCNIDSKRYNL